MAATILRIATNPVEYMQAMDATQLASLADDVFKAVDFALQDAEPAMAPPEDGAPVIGSQETVVEALNTLRACAVVAQAFIGPAERAAPPALLEAALALHDIIFDLQDRRASDLQAAIVDLCEAWWLSGRPGRDDLVPQAISYLLVRALHDGAAAADVKRLYGMRTALTVLDYGDEATGAMKKLLLQCVIHPPVLRHADGRKFLVSLFGLHPPFVAELHRAIKAQIPTCRKSLRELYGEVYFKAWRAADGASRRQLEEGCLQDIIYHAVHASSTAMATALRQARPSPPRPSPPRLALTPRPVYRCSRTLTSRSASAASTACSSSCTPSALHTPRPRHPLVATPAAPASPPRRSHL